MCKFTGAVALGMGLLLIPAAPVRGQSYSEVFKRVRDSVVVIRTREKDLPPRPGAQPVSVGGIGSGVLIAESGKVLTAAHVVQTADKIQVIFSNGESIPGRVISSVQSADVALLQLDRPPKKAVAVQLGDSDKAEVGDEVFVVGAPLGISYSLTGGRISARRQTNDVDGTMSGAELFQTDAAVNPGNSGGPMFNLDGEVVGIVSSILTHSGGFEGLGFAVTSNTARRLLLEHSSPWTGMDGYILTGDLARVFNLPQAMGILVQRVVEGSPAAKLGLHPGDLRAEIEEEAIIVGGDVILDVQGIKISEIGAMQKVRATLEGLKPGDRIAVGVLRAGQRLTLTSETEKP